MHLAECSRPSENMPSDAGRGHPLQAVARMVSPDHFLLEVGDLLGGKLHPEVPPSHHDAIRQL